MTTYQLTGEGHVIKDGDTKVPTTTMPGVDPHPETVAYWAWIEAGGVPLPADPVVLTPPEILQKIDDMEREKMLPRIVREMTIAQLEAWAMAQGYPLPAFRAANKGYRALKEFDEEIAALRSQLT